MSLSPVEWSRPILPNLFPLDKGVDLKIELRRRDFKLVMEMVASLDRNGFREAEVGHPLALSTYCHIMCLGTSLPFAAQEVR